ncbi:CopG family transcriptional regulator [Haematomicrobium sanguinis]|uniref:ribbon-helix-helix domain-containing protein n=1 Tax=Haematomicrobium sanguinis TaxID=479106 RepID=UPI0009496276
MYDYIMLRTQISLTPEERRLLDREAARTGRSISSLIREAVSARYGESRDLDRDRKIIESAWGAWEARSEDGERYVENVRSGRRLSRTSAP